MTLKGKRNTFLRRAVVKMLALISAFAPLKEASAQEFLQNLNPGTRQAVVSEIDSLNLLRRQINDIPKTFGGINDHKIRQLVLGMQQEITRIDSTIKAIEQGIEKEKPSPAFLDVIVHGLTKEQARLLLEDMDLKRRRLEYQKKIGRKDLIYSKVN